MSIKTSNEIEVNIIKDYNNGFGTMELAEKYQLHRSTIQRVLKRNNIKLRKKTPENKYNISFFNEYTRESCYWAGFIAADGNIRKDRNTVSIHLSVIDYEHLEKFKKIIDFTGEIESGNNDDCRISICGEWFVKSLREQFEILPQKILTTKISEKIPKEFLCDFVRGYFDGDGSITYSHGKPVCITFTSGSEIILNQLTKLFISLGVDIKGNNDNTPPVQNNAQISYSGENALKILKWMYKFPLSNDYYMDRKYNKYILACKT